MGTVSAAVRTNRSVILTKSEQIYFKKVIL